MSYRWICLCAVSSTNLYVPHMKLLCAIWSASLHAPQMDLIWCYIIHQPVCPPDSIMPICRNRLCAIWSINLYVLQIVLCPSVGIVSVVYDRPSYMSHILNCICAIIMFCQLACPTYGTVSVLYDRPSYMPISLNRLGGVWSTKLCVLQLEHSGYYMIDHLICPSVGRLGGV